MVQVVTYLLSVREPLFGGSASVFANLDEWTTGGITKEGGGVLFRTLIYPKQLREARGFIKQNYAFVSVLSLFLSNFPRFTFPFDLIFQLF